ncbi:hypothetical protein DICPUDRAFT_32637 [Dictyostelium purpureum]|uniref:Methionine aminopeptidase n=1 Tax=Dictyostelium purpureum TaxID=5786 RepID=F0ZJH4_DICPU|nr:uncharacterized protein DICPUDRAFT_32637 [Dictyostelium purpureum]EGC35900.1 hypothetical protein DICPUDRAFT_32637 [Dictyostelium purpureum]|eukprot:XP_003287554.1 hypothetical protein DICPUDRAFT_32637 [Dictyostelium purpureum]
MNKLINNNFIKNVTKFNRSNLSLLSTNKIINSNSFVKHYTTSNEERDREEIREFIRQQSITDTRKIAKPKNAINRKVKRNLAYQHNRNPDNIILGGIVSSSQPVPPHIQVPPYVKGEKVIDMDLDDPIEIHTPESIAGMRAVCKLAKEILHFAGTLVKPGITTDEIDKIVHEEIIRRGAYPSPLGYKGFPKSICTSVNEILCHGIPDDRPLQNGDIINIDVTVYLNGYHGDTSATFPVGEIDEAAKKLINIAQKALFVGMEAVKPGEQFKEIGRAIQTMTHKHSFGVAAEFTGHGIGKTFHCAPYVFQCVNKFDFVMKPGMIFTVEPLVVESTTPFVEWEMWDDEWTIHTKDYGWSAQFEHTILVTEDGYEILTE